MEHEEWCKSHLKATKAISESTKQSKLNKNRKEHSDGSIEGRKPLPESKVRVSSALHSLQEKDSTGSILADQREVRDWTNQPILEQGPVVLAAKYLQGGRKYTLQSTLLPRVLFKHCLLITFSPSGLFLIQISSPEGKKHSWVFFLLF